MEPALVILGLATFAFLVAGGITLGRIVDYLRAHGVSANYWSIRWMFPRYLAQYRQMTLEETGAVGSLFTTSGTLFALAAVFGLSLVASLIF